MIDENTLVTTVRSKGLYNPCVHILLIIVLLIFLSTRVVHGQSLIKGQVIDSLSNEPIIGYTLELLKNDGNYISGTTGDTEGNFEITYPKRNWMILRFSHLGYSTKSIRINKETLQPFYNIALVPEVNVFDDLEIIATPYHYFKTSKIGEISINKFHPGMAASFGDPSRSVLRIPGTGTQSDQANAISYHGLPNEMVNWKIDGAEILNPNHLNTAGTISNRPSSNAGGVLAVPFEVLDRYTFLPSPFSKSHGNAIAGISNLTPRAHIPNRNGFAKIGLLGLEAGLSRKFTGTTAVQAHYRYSFTGLLGDAGVNFDGEEIRYQDLFVKLHFVNTEDARTSLTFIGGHNKNRKADVLFQSTEGYTGSLGLSSFKKFSDKSRINTSLFFSATSDDGFTSFGEGNNSDPLRTNLLFDRQTKAALFSEYKYQASENNTHIIGLNANFWDYQYLYNEASASNVLLNDIIFADIDRRSFYGNLSYGLEIRTNDWLVKPEFAIAYTPKNNIFLEPGITIGKDFSKAKFLAGANFSNQNQDIAIYALAERELDRQSGGQPNLENNRAINSYASLSYSLSTEKKSDVMLKVFNHYLFNLAIPDTETSYFPYSGVDYLRPAKLRNQGLARSTGMEASVDHAFSDDLLFVINGSVFSSVYQRDGENFDYPAPNNFGFTSNAFATRKFMVGSGELFLSLAAHYRGGAYSARVDVAATESTRRTTYSSDFEQLGNYFRLDTRLNYTFKKKNQLILDIQNLTNTRNEGYFDYNHTTNEEFVKKQLGLIPVISYRREF